MSKIGRKAIELHDVQVTIDGQKITYKGKKDSGEYILPPELEAVVEGKQLFVRPTSSGSRLREINRIWGLHRALLASKISGAHAEFEKQIEIIGLGFKAAIAGKKITFSLGYSHKIDFTVPEKVVVETDKTGQLLTVKSPNKDLVGQVCSNIKALRRPEPYKGTGIKLKSETILRKAGKTKAA